jgi:hypothetical protein
LNDFAANPANSSGLLIAGFTAWPLGKIQRNAKRRTLSHLTLQIDMSLMIENDILGIGQAQAGTPGLRCEVSLE